MSDPDVPSHALATDRAVRQYRDRFDLLDYRQLQSPMLRPLPAPSAVSSTGRQTGIAGPISGCTLFQVRELSEPESESCHCAWVRYSSSSTATFMRFEIVVVRSLRLLTSTCRLDTPNRATSSPGRSPNRDTRRSPNQFSYDDFGICRSE